MADLSTAKTGLGTGGTPGKKYGPFTGKTASVRDGIEFTLRSFNRNDTLFSGGRVETLRSYNRTFDVIEPGNLT